MTDRYCEECRFIKDEGGEHGTCTLHNCHVYKNYKVCFDYQAEEMFNHEEFEV